jgi:hypothetical protein
VRLLAGFRGYIIFVHRYENTQVLSGGQGQAGESDKQSRAKDKVSCAWSLLEVYLNYYHII